MTSTQPVPLEVLQIAMTDRRADVRWYATEALQKCLTPEALKLAKGMQLDTDQFVRISANDAIAMILWT